jgi:hypothetical protein
MKFSAHTFDDGQLVVARTDHLYSGVHKDEPLVVVGRSFSQYYDVEDGAGVRYRTLGEELDLPTDPARSLNDFRNQRERRRRYCEE